jgi:hypothetical protein
VGVIYLPLWRIYHFLDEGRSVIHRWLEEEAFTVYQKVLLQNRIELFGAGGRDTLPGSIIHVEGDFWAFNVTRKGEIPMNPIFCYGPFHENEITFLAGAPLKRGLLKPHHVLPVAQHNLGILLRDPRRRIREELT